MRRHLNPRTAAPAGRSFVEAKLALVEFFLSTDDVVQVTQASVQWLLHHTHVQCAFVALVASDGSSLIGAASAGLSSATVAEFALDVRDRRHPLVACHAGP